MSFRQYVFTRKYGFGRGSKASWAFITHARGDRGFPDAKTWAELRDYLTSSAMPEDMIGAAKVVWGSYQSRRDRLRKPAPVSASSRAPTGPDRPHAI